MQCRALRTLIKVGKETSALQRTLANCSAQGLFEEHNPCEFGCNCRSPKQQTMYASAYVHGSSKWVAPCCKLVNHFAEECPACVPLLVVYFYGNATYGDPLPPPSPLGKLTPRNNCCFFFLPPPSQGALIWPRLNLTGAERGRDTGVFEPKLG